MCTLSLHPLIFTFGQRSDHTDKNQNLVGVTYHFWIFCGVGCVKGWIFWFPFSDIRVARKWCKPFSVAENILVADSVSRENLSLMLFHRGHPQNEKVCKWWGDPSENNINIWSFGLDHLFTRSLHGLLIARRHNTINNVYPRATESATREFSGTIKG